MICVINPMCLTVTTQQETNTEEIDHLPIPLWGRRRKRTMILPPGPYSGLTNYVDAIQAFDVSIYK